MTSNILSSLIDQLEEKREKKKVFFALQLSLLFVSLMLLTKVIEWLFETSFVTLGVYPQTGQGLFGIITSPFIHGDWKHLWSNIPPMFVLGSLFVYFHRRNFKEVFVLLWVVSGLWLWFFGRQTYHVGASGLIYALAAYLITYGFVLRNAATLAITFLVILFYGSMIWFVLPIMERISWEGHLTGALSGVFLGIYYGKEAKRQLYRVSGAVNFTFTTKFSESVRFNYEYKEKKEK